MHNAGPGNFLELRAMVQQAVEECPRAIAGCGMYHRIHGFVEDDDVVVFINDIQVYIFWSMGFFDGKHSFQHQFVAGIDLVLASELLAIDQ